MLMRTGACERTRWRVLLAVAALAVLQIAAVSHLVGHSAAGDSAGCAVCLAATEAGGAVPAAGITVPLFLATTSHAVESPLEPTVERSGAAYRARAPPVSI